MARVRKETIFGDAEAMPLANGSQEGLVQAAPPAPMPLPLNGWFVRTWQYLYEAHLLNDPNEIVAFSQTTRSVTVRLANGQEYCIDKVRF